MSGVWVVLEERNGRISTHSREALVAACSRGAQHGMAIHAVVMGAQTEALAEEARHWPMQRLVRVENALLAEYSADGYLSALEQLFRTEAPECVVFPHSYQVRDFAPALAARFGQMLIADVVGIEAGMGNEAGPLFTRQLLQGRLLGHYRHAGDGPCFVSVQAGAFGSELLREASSAVECILFRPALDAAQIRTQSGSRFQAVEQGVDLASARRIVSIGRGIEDAKHIPMIEELASLLGAEVAASRPICDLGWLPLERQVGSSGQTVAPDLYLAIGISGAIQHQVGMKGAQCIVAINKDSDAPIFEIADYGIVGDLFEVVPALIAALKEAMKADVV
jgi:electron transfer flavoprotein alpha subunit